MEEQINYILTFLAIQIALHCT